MDPLTRMHRAWLISLFSYGAVVHVLLLRLLVLREYRPPVDATFVNNPLTNIGVALIAGGCVALLFRPLLREQTARAGDEPYLSIIKGGFYGILASVLALEIFLASCALIVTIYSFYKAGGRAQFSISDFPPMFGLMWLSIHTYEFFEFPRIVPFGVAYGAVAGFVLARFRAKALQVRAH